MILSYNTIQFLHVRSTSLHGARSSNYVYCHFWAPRALFHSFSSPAMYPRCLFVVHSTTLHEGSTKQFYYNTIITAVFGAPMALAHPFFTSRAMYPRYLHYTLPIPTAAALNTSTNYTHFGPFLGPSTTTKLHTRSTNGILSYTDQ